MFNLCIPSDPLTQVLDTYLTRHRNDKTYTKMVIAVLVIRDNVGNDPNVHQL